MADTSKKVLRKLDKIYLNQEIVYLRDTAKNAKINVIRKLTKQIKKLKEVKKDLPEKIQLKNNNKAARLIEEIQIIKTITKDDISVVALIYDPAECLKLSLNQEIPVKDRLEAKIACNKVIVTRIEKILTKYEPVTRKELEDIMSTIGAKKKKKKKVLQIKESQGGKTSIESTSSDCEQQNPKGISHQDSGVSSENFDDEVESNNSTNKHKKSKHEVVASLEEVDAERQENGADHSIKKRKKSKHEVTSSEEIDAETQEYGADRSTKKHKKAKHEVANLEEFDAEMQENGTDHSIKKRKKSKHEVASSGEVDAERQENGAERSTKKHKKGKHEVAEEEFDDEAHDIGRVKKSGKKRQKTKHAEMTDNCDSDAEVEYESAEEGAVIHKKSPKIGKKKELDAVSSKPKKAVVPSTKAIRFSDLLLMESESLQSANPTKTTSSVVEKDVDEFFVSGDGRGTFMARAPSPQRSANPASKEKAEYVKLRAQYLKEYGAVPNRKELRRLEKEGLIGKKSLLKGCVEPPGSAASASGVQPPPRLFLRKLTRDELPVHPSWEAKKQAKEKLVVPFQGTKISFD